MIAKIDEIAKRLEIEQLISDQFSSVPISGKDLDSNIVNF